MPPRDRADVDRLLPLRPVTFQILLTLAGGERHGYGITQDIAGRTSAKMRLEPGNLYRSLRAMLDDGVIEESERRPAPDLDDERRRSPDHPARPPRRGRRDRPARSRHRRRESKEMAPRALTAYRLLIRAFPRAFRDRFGDDLTDVFADRLREARRTGRFAVAALWLDPSPTSPRTRPRSGGSHTRCPHVREDTCPVLDPMSSLPSEASFGGRASRSRSD